MNAVLLYKIAVLSGRDGELSRDLVRFDQSVGAVVLEIFLAFMLRQNQSGLIRGCRPA